MKKENVALFGLGKLGLPLALILSQYYKVHGIDVDTKKVSDLKSGILPFFESNLDEYLRKNVNNISFETIEEYDIEDFDIAVILVNTPSNEKGEFSNNYIYDVIRNLAEKLKTSNKKDFLFILSSTVMPNSHVDIIGEIEKISGKKLNDGFGFVYIPDLVALGSVIHDFENPDLVIVGESDEKYGTIAIDLYSKFIKNNSPHVRMSLIESEITKVSLNAYITMKISFANFIGNIADKFNCNPNKITKALGYDRRISPYYIKSGLAFGGTCFPRDTWAFIKMSDSIGLDAAHIKATQKINEYQNKKLFDELSTYKEKKIGIYGLSFKMDTYNITDSPGHIIYEQLKEKGYEVFGCDKLVETDFNSKNSVDFLEKIDVLLIAHPDSNWVNKHCEIIKNKIIINPWKIKI